MVLATQGKSLSYYHIFRTVSWLINASFITAAEELSQKEKLTENEEAWMIETADLGTSNEASNENQTTPLGK